MEKTSDKDGADSRKFHASVAMASTVSSTNEAVTAAVSEAVEIKPICVADNDSVFPDPLLQVNKQSFITLVSCFFCYY